MFRKKKRKKTCKPSKPLKHGLSKSSKPLKHGLIFKSRFS